MVCFLLLGILLFSQAEFAWADIPALDSASTRRKIQVSDPALARQIAAAGGKLIADYGSFQLYDLALPTTAVLNHPAVEIRDEFNVIWLNAAPLDTRRSEVQALRHNLGAFEGKHLHLVQFAGPVLPVWHAEILATGVQIVTYIPENAYLVYGDAASLGRLQMMGITAGHIQWEGAYLDAYKLDPAARPLNAQGQPREIGTTNFAIQLLADADANSATVALLDRLKLGPILSQDYALGYLTIIIPLAAKDLALVAARPEVVSIQPFFPPRKYCERQAQIVAGNLAGNSPGGPGYLAWLASKGFTQAQFAASAFAVDISDSGLDNGTTSPNHPGLRTAGAAANASRVIYNRIEGTPNSGSTIKGCDGHGTLNTHIIGGYDSFAAGFPHTDIAGYHYGLGICPFIALGSSVIFDPDFFTFPNFANLQSKAYHDAVRVSNNSWGADNGGVYNISCQQYDALVRDAQPTGSSFPVAGNQEMVIVFAAGNSGPDAATIGAPGSAKNVITVGAAESVQTMGGADGCGTFDFEADSANDMTTFSSRGPCFDNRRKPDLVAPGSHVSGGVAQALNPGANGTADTCFDGFGVCGSSTTAFFPLNQQLFTVSSGTSHSAPAVAGGCALIRQYFINNFNAPPSPAMTKAFLMNSARYMTGVDANDTLWSDNQGMGAVNLGFALDGASRILRDEISVDKFTATGQKRTFTGIISDPSRPFRVTLAWTDAPGSTSGNAYNNDLDLTVTVGGSTYKGNLFNGAVSVTGGSADSQNNTESVFLPAGVCGSFVVTVTAANINSDGVPNEEPVLDQDFALVIYNGTTAAVPVIAPQSALISAESCTPTNGAADPGEVEAAQYRGIPGHSPGCEMRNGDEETPARYEDPGERLQRLARRRQSFGDHGVPEEKLHQQRHVTDEFDVRRAQASQ